MSQLNGATSARNGTGSQTSSTGPAKATLTNLDTKETFECLFNPTEYSYTLGNHWTPKRANKRSMAHLQYTGGDNSSLTLELFFDTVEPHKLNGEMVSDVRKYVNKLEEFMTPNVSVSGDQKRHKRPPYLRFQWGDHYLFKSVLKDMQVRYTLFNQKGDPIRCTANVTLLSIESDSEDDQLGTNPTSFAEPGHKRREVMPQDTLALIAYQEYGNPNKWRRIAEANGLEDPLDLHPGQILAIPPA